MNKDPGQRRIEECERRQIALLEGLERLSFVIQTLIKDQSLTNVAEYEERGRVCPQADRDAYTKCVHCGGNYAFCDCPYTLELDRKFGK